MPCSLGLINQYNNMNKNIIILFILVAGFTQTSCVKNYLDKLPNDDLTLDSVFGKRNYAEAFLTSTYANFPFEIDVPDYGGRNPFIGSTDEMEITYPGSYTHVINSGSWGPTNVLDNWLWAYQGIRKTNLFLQNVDKVPLDASFTADMRTQWKGEATFLRAYFHFNVFRLYGPIAIEDHAVTADADFTKIKRRPLDSCVNFMVNDCNQAAALLPLTQTPDKVGRATKVAALALKARILLYAASPLFNGNADYNNLSNKDGEHLFPSNYDAAKWQLAAQAAKDCIDQSEGAGYGLYAAVNNDPVQSYTELFLKNNNKEILFANNVASYQHLERCSNPLSYGGYSILSVSQEQVDAYEMADGSTPITGYAGDGSPLINPASGYQETGYAAAASPRGYYPAGVSNMYVNREPRFYASVHFAGEQWKGRAIQLWFNGADGKSKNPSDFCKTGYLLKKFSNPSINIAQNTGWELKTWILFRLGEQYLNYAEALNESQGPVSEVYKYVNAIRNRAGLPSLDPGLSKEQMREKIRHERRVELSFETHRYFDCRRWKIMAQTNNGALHGLNINAGNGLQDNAFYKRSIADQRVFQSPKHYLWPLPQDELNKNPSFVQNPGW